MKKIFISLVIVFTAYSYAFGQEKSNIKRDTTKGFDFFFNAGMYVGNKKNANYYRGIPNSMESDYADPNIMYVLGTGFFRQQIMDIILDNYNAENDTSKLKWNDLSGMRYTASMSFGIGIRYRFGKNLSIGVVLTQARMTAQGTAYLGVKIYETNSNDEVKCGLVGKERRTAFELIANYIFPTQSMVSPFLEVGLHVNNTKVVSSNVIVENHSFTMINLYGPNHDPTITQTQLNPRLGGVGYGFSAAFGLRISFNKWAAIEPTAQFRLEKVNLAGYNSMTPNYNFMIRLVIGDKIFAKKVAKSE